TIKDDSVAEGDPTAQMAGKAPRPRSTNGDNFLTFVATLSSVSGKDAFVDYATGDGTAMAADSDYGPASGTLVIPQGTPSAVITVEVIGDRKFEANETMIVSLTNPVNAILGNDQATGTLLNDNSLSMSVRSGWNMISAPAELADDTVHHLFPQATSNAF